MTSPRPIECLVFLSYQPQSVVASRASVPSVADNINASIERTSRPHIGVGVAHNAVWSWSAAAVRSAPPSHSQSVAAVLWRRAADAGSRGSTI
ncbi:hypothetical protein PG988_000300 [Apiospora saccharicola]